MESMQIANIISYLKLYPLLWPPSPIIANDLFAATIPTLQFFFAITTPTNGLNRDTATMPMHHGANRATAATPSLSSPKVSFNFLPLTRTYVLLLLPYGRFFSSFFFFFLLSKSNKFRARGLSDMEMHIYFLPTYA